MRTYRALLPATALTISAAFGSLPAAAQPIQYFAILEGAYETGGGDPDGHGVASILINGTSLCFTILTRNIAMPTAAHIHRGKAGAAGAIHLGLTTPTLAGNVARVANCVSTTAAKIAAIRNAPSSFYVNVHNAAFPNGAIRGQLF
jgi:hypothetical protein